MLRTLLVIIVLAVSAAAAQPDLPLWEVGVAGGGGSVPDYPAAGQNHFKGIGAPYLIYRGEILRADRDGARAQLLESRYVNAELSVAASFASDSEDNDARRGMPDLDHLLEFGPRLTWTLWRDDQAKIRLFTPLRAVFSTDLGNFHHRGFSFTPSIHYRRILGGNYHRFFAAQLSSNFGDRPLNAYFYDVQPAFTQPDRPFYDARAGYMGSDLYAGVVLPIGKRFRFFTGAQILLHSASANETSPLFRHHVNYAAFAGGIWALYRSKRPAVTAD